MRNANVTRREFLRLVTVGAVGVVAVACGGAPVAVAPTAAPATGSDATAVPAADAAPTAVPQQDLSVGTLKEVPRNQTAVLGWEIGAAIGATNPWVAGYTHQAGNAFMWEPLMYFGIFSDKEIPWLADSMEYTKDDFTELTVKLNSGAKWSDGTPVTSKDVAYTFEGQLNNNKLPYHSQFDQFVEGIKVVDDQTIVVTFKLPSPRFKFEVLMLKFDTGIPIVPADALSKQADVNAYPGGLEIPHSGPYDLVLWDATQKIYDLREDWWAVAAGRSTLPEVKRIVIVNITGVDPNVVAQRTVNNEFDSTLDMRSAVIGSVLEQNKKVTSWTSDGAPYGCLLYTSDAADE